MNPYGFKIYVPKTLKFQVRTLDSRCKVDMLECNTTIIRAPIFDWYVVMCGSKTWHQKDMCLKRDLSMCSNMVSILCSMFNMIGGGEGGLYKHSMSVRIFTLIMNKLLN